MDDKYTQVSSPRLLFFCLFLCSTPSTQAPVVGCVADKHGAAWTQFITGLALAAAGMPLLISIEESVESPWLLGGIFHGIFHDLSVDRCHKNGSGTCVNIRWRDRYQQIHPVGGRKSQICDFRLLILRLVVLFYGLGFGILQAFLMVHTLQARIDRTVQLCSIPL